MTPIKYIKAHYEESKKTKEAFFKDNLRALDAAARMIGATFKLGRKILIIGNGGSAADAQHMAAEFTGRFKHDRQALPAIALTTDTSALTAISNDYGFDQVFSRQVRALGAQGDILIAISTSGNSQNVLNAVKMANERGMLTISLTGGDGGSLSMASYLNINASIATNSATCQESHIFAIHTIVGLVETFYL